MVTVSMMSGRGLVGEMVGVPVPMLNWIVSAPARLLDSWIAALSEHLFTESAHMPFPGKTSDVSVVTLTVKVERGLVGAKTGRLAP